MIRSIFAFVLALAAACFLGACEQHTWEETKSLHQSHHGDAHGDHDDGHDKDGAGHSKEEAGHDKDGGDHDKGHN